MQPRKTQLFNAKAPVVPTNIISATVKFEHDKKAGAIKPLTAEQKMLCALRKCLTKMSDTNPDGARYYIAGNKVELLQPPSTTAGKVGEAQSYRAGGRCRVRKAHAGHVTSTFIEFSISYRDTKDDRGLADVEVTDPTTIDEIDRATAVNLTHLQ